MLILPDLARLPDYAAAVARGWSQSSTRDVSAEQHAAIAADPAGFVARALSFEGGRNTLPDGTVVPLIPGTTRWVWDGGFCGTVNLRHVPNTTELPPHVSGHIGYSIVPWRQREGHATRALRLMLPLAADAGLPHVIVTCDTDNPASRKVIEANGGVFLHQGTDMLTGHDKLVFQITLTFASFPGA